MRGVHHLGGLAGPTASLKGAGSAGALTGKRFWRLYDDAYQTSYSTAFRMDTLEFRGSPEGTSLTDAEQDIFHRRAFAYGKPNNDHIPGNVFDTSGSSYWYGERSGWAERYIGYMFPEDTEVNEVYWVCGHSSQFIQDVTIQSSPDGEVWTNEWSTTGHTSGANTSTRP